MPKYSMIEPGADPTADVGSGGGGFELSGKNLVLIISGVGLALVLILNLVTKKPAQAKAQPTATPTATATLLAATPLSTGDPPDRPLGSPTVTTTQYVPVYMRTPGGSIPTQPATQPAQVITQLVQVTRVVSVNVDRPYPVVTVQVITVQVPLQQTVMVTTTPLPSETPAPTQTPWIVYQTQIVEVTREVTPTETQTATPTETLMPIGE